MTHVRATTITRPTGAAALLAAAWLAGTLPGQTRIDDGRLLDRNTRLGGDGINEAARVEDFRARNLVVTGNVAGGRGFRDTVGYAAENDFRGALGSDDLFPFLAGSAYSAPSFLTASGTYERLRFGGYLGTVEFRRSGGFGTSLNTINEIRYQNPAGVLTAPDQFNLDHVSLAAMPGMRVAASAQPEIVGAFKDDEGRPVIASASMLRGLQLVPLTGLPESIGLPSFDMARARQDLEAGRPLSRIGEPFNAGFRNLDPAWAPPAAPSPAPPAGGAAASATATDSAAAPQAFTNRIDPAREPEYRAILEKVASRYQESTGTGSSQRELLETLDQQLTRLRDSLASQAAAAEPVAPDGAAAVPPDGASIEQLGPVLRHGQRVDRLASPDRTRFSELMSSAEEALAQGEYFWAERRFDRALRFTPGHPLAMAGLGHARIGAGLYASAAFTLRRLLIEHPEMIDTTYEPQLLPNGMRLDAVVRTLSVQVAEPGREQALLGFLLAYIGHQLGDFELVDRGLMAMAAAAPDDPLVALLRTVWGK